MKPNRTERSGKAPEENQDGCKRREFFCRAGKLLVAGLTLGALPAVAWGKRGFIDERLRGWKQKPYWGFAINIDQCIGCGSCARACKEENDVPPYPFYFRTWVERYVIDKHEEVDICSPNGGIDGYPPVDDPGMVVKTFYVPKLCNHCDNSPCEQVCPVGATFKTKDGAVLIDRKHCIGCRYCIQACPYGTRYFNPELHVADKCTMCYHRITKGLRPACVEVCPARARVFGDLSDEGSEITRFINRFKVQVLKSYMGTEPKLVYKGLDRHVR